MKQTILSFLLMLLPIMAWADDSGDCGENAIWTYEESTKTLTISGSGAIYDFVVDDHSYVRTKWLSLVVQTIIIEDGITSLGHEAFAGFNNLTSVTIGNDVKSIGYWSFCDCRNLTTISIPNGVTSIDPYAFEGCSSLTSMSLPEGLTVVSEHAFSGCSSLTSIIIPEGVTSIEGQAFYNCSNLTSITIPYSVNSISSNAFYGCENINTVIIGIKNPINISNETFPSRANATLYVPYGSKNAYKKAIYWSDFNDILESDYDHGTCGENVTYTYDSKTHTLTISGTGPMKDLNDEFGWCAAPWEKYKNEIKRVIIENGVTSIGGYTFYDCSGLTSVTIPDGVTLIGPDAFVNCI